MKITNSVVKNQAIKNSSKGEKTIKPSAYSFKDALNNIENSWMFVQHKSDKLISTLPLNVRPLVETQILVNELSLKAQMITRAGESVASTLRRIQQFGS